MTPYTGTKKVCPSNFAADIQVRNLTSAGSCLGTRDEVAEDADSLHAGVVMAKELAGRSLCSFAASKRLLADSFDTSFETHIERERSALFDCAAHPDGQEGLKAFTEKRKHASGVLNLYVPSLFAVCTQKNPAHAGRLVAAGTQCKVANELSAVSFAGPQKSLNRRI